MIYDIVEKFYVFQIFLDEKICSNKVIYRDRIYCDNNKNHMR